ncbi:hypothetical protein BJ875DRAFT_527822 [Amylocarpus encephaloides]|uniref:Uncharacterized protein n=1 Tax=Amylocarpus encephaloides TaxID=45428 RepID=A0A9P8BZR1_9HELO|nr:hypothetical protein BJ875DRAFT_527822 [Amylocarpus encephaloides]
MTNNEETAEVRATLLVSSEEPRILTPDIEVANLLSPTNSNLYSYFNNKRPRFFEWSICLVSIAIVLVVISGPLFYARTCFIPNPSKSSVQIIPPSEWGYCGNTTATAHAHGCVYDLIPGAWVPPACFDEELEDEFLALSEWQWFADINQTKEVSLKDLKATGGPNLLYVSTPYHVQHCVFTWKKLHRAIIHQKPIDTQIGRYGHTEHCAMALAANLSGPAEFHTIFTGCKLPDDPDLSNGTALGQWANLV